MTTSNSTCSPGEMLGRLWPAGQSVKSIEYYDDGSVRRVEFYEPAPMFYGSSKSSITTLDGAAERWFAANRGGRIR